MSREFYIDSVITKHIAKSMTNTAGIHIDWLTPITLFWTDSLCFKSMNVCSHEHMEWQMEVWKCEPWAP